MCVCAFILLEYERDQTNAMAYDLSPQVATK